MTSGPCASAHAAGHGARARHHQSKYLLNHQPGLLVSRRTSAPSTPHARPRTVAPSMTMPMAGIAVLVTVSSLQVDAYVDGSSYSAQGTPGPGHLLLPPAAVSLGPGLPSKCEIPSFPARSRSTRPSPLGMADLPLPSRSLTLALALTLTLARTHTLDVYSIPRSLTRTTYEMIH